MFRPYTVLADHKDFQVGDQAHITLYTDSNPYTVIERKGKRIKLQRAKAKLDPTWKPEMIAGGFAGHCVNNREQRWIITENPDGEITEGYLGTTTNGMKREATGEPSQPRMGQISRLQLLKYCP